MLFARHRLAEEGRAAVQPLKALAFPCFQSILLGDGFEPVTEEQTAHQSHLSSLPCPDVLLEPQ